jgi:hypothetical protein
MIGIDVPAAIVAVGLGIMLNIGVIAAAIYLRLRH